MTVQLLRLEPTVSPVIRDLKVVEDHIAKMEGRIQRLRGWIEEDRAEGHPTLMSGSLLQCFEDTLSLDRCHRLDLIARL